MQKSTKPAKDQHQGFPGEDTAPFPTPAQVRSMCREIQAGWTTAEREKRLVVKGRRWSAPMVKVAELGLSRDIAQALS